MKNTAHSQEKVFLIAVQRSADKSTTYNTVAYITYNTITYITLKTMTNTTYNSFQQTVSQRLKKWPEYVARFVGYIRAKRSFAIP